MLSTTAHYRDFLRRRGISYLIAGEEALDKALALEKLNSLFGMERVMIGGGGVLNWSFLHAGLVDEISLVVAPFADGDTTNPGLFSAVAPLSAPQARSFTLIEARELRDSVLLVRYRVNPAAG
jgi:riboflavin biosynthesis pyrimidine reductase